MRSGIGVLVKGAGYVALAISGIWGFLLNLAIIGQAAGFWGFVAAFTIFPVTYIATPWYAGVALGNWFPLLVCYGGVIVAAILMAVGSAIAGDDA